MSDDAAAPLLTQPEAAAIPPEYRAGVATQLQALLAQARLVEEFVLPDDLEQASASAP
jgi:Protein of unknown function (DUF4089)